MSKTHEDEFEKMTAMNDTSERPEPNSVPGGIDSETDLRTGADDSPDILQGPPEDEPELSSLTLKKTSFRIPRPGARLTEDELEREIDTD